MELTRLAIEIFLDMLAFWRCHYLFKRTCLQLSFKIGVLKNFPNFTGKQQPFFNKVADLGVATLLKRVCNTGVFLWNLRNCEEQFFVQISPGNCYYLLLSIHFVVINRYFNFWQIVDLKQRYTVARVVDQAMFDNIS